MFELHSMRYKKKGYIQSTKTNTQNILDSMVNLLYYIRNMSMHETPTTKTGSGVDRRMIEDTHKTRVHMFTHIPHICEQMIDVMR